MELNEEKRERILNAAMEEFARQDFKHASTDDIAAKAGISKGLLFYYYKNKAALYLACYRCALSMVIEQMRALRQMEETDFFAIMEWGAQAKLELLRRRPYLLDFSMRAWFSQNEAVSGAIQKLIGRDMDGIYRRFFKSVDLYKFKEGVDPSRLLTMLGWMADGYLGDKRRKHEALDIDEMMVEFRTWTDLIRPMVYKEEYW